METGKALAVDRRWASSARWALGSAAAFLVLAVSIDGLSGGLTLLRAGLWALLAGLLFLVFMPERVSAGEGWLEVRGLVRRQRVATGELTSVLRSGGIAVLLIMTDAQGRRLGLNLRVLVANPVLWHRLETDAGHALKRGILREGADVLRELDEQISGREARGVFARSGL